jgi:hypothetical protein
MDPVTTIVVLLIGLAVVGWLATARDGRALDVFGSGFIGYRSYGWPHGVQEEDQVHFTVAALRERAAVDADADGPTSTPELIELAETADTIRLERLR